MVRIILIGVGLVTTAVVGYFAKKKLSRVFREDAVPLPEEPAPEVFQPAARVRKSRSSQARQPLENGEQGLSPLS